jgi:glycosyltransferase involved in cell wall biosynthesis
MRVLMLAQFYPPNMGGEEQHVRTLSHALAQRGHSVAVATLWHEGLAVYDLDGEVRVHRVRSTLGRASLLFSDQARHHATPFPDPETTLGVKRVVEQERPEIVHAHNWLLHSFLPLKKWSGAKFVVTLHDYSLVCAQKRLMYRDVTPCSGPALGKCVGCAIEHYGAAKGLTTVAGNWASGLVERRAVDLFLAVSRATAAGNGLVGSGLPYQVIPNFLLEGLDSTRPDTSSYLDQLPKEEFLLFVGDVVPDKGVNTLLDAYAGLEGAPPLVLIGRTSEQSPKSLPPNARVLSSWPHDAVMQAWRRSMVGLLPSQVPETFGLVVLEAMSAGRPVIASRSGGLSEVVVDGETGFLVPPGEVEALRRAIERLLADAGLRERMGEAARVRAAEFRASEVVPRVEQAYADLLEKVEPFATARTPHRSFNLDL